MTGRTTAAALTLAALCALSACGARSDTVEAPALPEVVASADPTASPSRAIEASGLAPDDRPFHLDCAAEGRQRGLHSDARPDPANPPGPAARNRSPEEVFADVLARLKDQPEWAEFAQLTWERRPAPEPTDGEWADYDPAVRKRAEAHLPLDAFFVGTRPDGAERGAVKLTRFDPYYVWDQQELYSCGDRADGNGTSTKRPASG